MAAFLSSKALVALIAVFIYGALLSEANGNNLEKFFGNKSSRFRRAISSHTFSKDNIPGTDLKTGTFYVLRMKRFPSGFVSWSTRKHDNGYNYVFVDNVAAHRAKYEKGGEWHKDVQWSFLSSSEPGWYHLINRASPCQYATWSDSETIDSDGTFYMTIDPNYPGSHAEEDFLFRPVPASNEAVDKPFYQLKLKSLPNAVVAWNVGNSSNEAYYIHVESTDDTSWLNRYSWGHIWYDDTLFSFEETRNQEEERFVEEDTEEHVISLQRQYATLVGHVGYDYNSGCDITAKFNMFLFFVAVVMKSYFLH